MAATELEKYGIQDSSSARAIVDVVESVSMLTEKAFERIRNLSVASLAIMQGRAFGYLANWSEGKRNAWVGEMVEMRRVFGTGDEYEQRATVAFLETLKEAVQKEVSGRLLLADSEYRQNNNKKGDKIPVEPE